MSELPPMTLILGGARSGKSQHAEALVLATDATPIYLATGAAHDDEMAERIRQHKERRGERWRTVEEPLDLADALQREATPGKVVLVDCLTLWLGNLMGADRNIERDIAALLDILPSLSAPIVLVSNEVGQGIVPDNALARRFRDLAGSMHQDLAAIADRVDFVTAGLAQRLK